MDSDHFDALTRSFASSPSRRAVARSLPSLLIGGTVGLLGFFEGEGKKRRRKRKRKRKKKDGNDTPPFCAGRDNCISTVRCQSSGNDCFCWVTEGTGEPFCGIAVAFPAACADCRGEERCIDVGECDIGENPTACAIPCPDPL
jgi:hypothetical protein